MCSKTCAKLSFNLCDSCVLILCEIRAICGRIFNTDLHRELYTYVYKSSVTFPLKSFHDEPGGVQHFCELEIRNDDLLSRFTPGISQREIHHR